MWDKNKILSSKDDIAKVICQYIPMFQACKLEKKSLAIYAKLLQDLPLENITMAFEILVTQTKFFPTVAEVREVAERLIWDITFRAKYMG